MDPFSVLELSTRAEEQGNISLDCIDWGKFKEFNWKKNFVQYTGLSKDIRRALPSDRLKYLQCSYYTHILAKEPQQQQALFFDGPSWHRGDQYVAYESRTQAADNSLQLDRIMKVSKVAPPHKKICTEQLFLGKRVTLKNIHLKLERITLQKLTFQYLQVITAAMLAKFKKILIQNLFLTQTWWFCGSLAGLGIQANMKRN